MKRSSTTYCLPTLLLLGLTGCTDLNDDMAITLERSTMIEAPPNSTLMISGTITDGDGIAEVRLRGQGIDENRVLRDMPTTYDLTLNINKPKINPGEVLTFVLSATDINNEELSVPFEVTVR